MEINVEKKTNDKYKTSKKKIPSIKESEKAIPNQLVKKRKKEKKKIIVMFWLSISIIFYFLKLCSKSTVAIRINFFYGRINKFKIV